MKISKIEQETVYIFNEEEKTAIVDTFNKKLLNRLAETAELYPEECKLKREHEMGNKAYELPKSWVGGVKLPMKLSAEQKAARAARLKNKRGNREE